MYACFKLASSVEELITPMKQTGRVTVDGWLEMNAPAQTAVLFKELRGALNAVLQERIGKPQVSKVSKPQYTFLAKHVHRFFYLVIDALNGV